MCVQEKMVHFALLFYVKPPGEEEIRSLCAPKTAFQPFCTLSKAEVKQQPTQSSMARANTKKWWKNSTPFLRKGWKSLKINFVRISKTAHTWKYNFTRKPFWELATSKFYASKGFEIGAFQRNISFRININVRVRADGKQAAIKATISNELKSKSHFVTAGWESTMWLVIFSPLIPYTEHSWILEFNAFKHM